MEDRADSVRPLCAIPVYNHAGTLPALVRQCLAQVPDVLVVDDGSTDADVPLLLAGSGATVLRHAANRGKGAALLTALDYARERGFTHLVTLDADGQHAPADLPRVLAAIRSAPQAVVVGVRDLSVPHVPESSRFGRAFSNFWIALETGVTCADTQCGYRAYPVGLVSQLRLSGRRYDFEVEVLVRALWAGLPLVEVAVETYYAPPGERVSHFRKGLDNLRLTHAHAKLVLRRLCPWPARRLLPRAKARAWRELLRPADLIRRLLRESATPAGLGASAAVGTLLAVLPLPFVHTLAILYVTARLRLNTVLALAIQNLFMPPFTPALCILLGHFLLCGERLPELPRNMTILTGYLLEWLVGSLLLAPLFAAVSGLVVYKAAAYLQRRAAESRAGAPRRGNALGFWFFRAALRLTGLRGAYGLLYIVCAYYAAFDRAAVAGADAYLRRRFPGRSRLARRLGAYRLFIQQGKCLIDRHAHNAGARAFEIDSAALGEVRRRVGAGGYVLLLAHAGGWQLALPSLGRLAGDRPVSLLMRAAETPDVRANVRGDDAGFHVIEPDGPGCAVELVARLQRGEIVSVMGDRAYGGQTAAAPFLGEDAHFPATAFAVARAAQRPVVALFVPKTGVARYRLEAVVFDAPARDDRSSVRRGVCAFAAALEAFAWRYPFQCFLFEDVWATARAQRP